MLATFALILILNEGVQMLCGTDLPLSAPAALAGPVELLPGLHYPAYRLLIIAVGLLLALLLYLLVQKTRLGMLVRAGASNREMAARWAWTSAGCSRWCSASARRCARWPARCSGRCWRCRWAWARTS